MNAIDNPILKADSYKASHYLQYPPGTTFVSSYIEPRWNKDGQNKIMFFGLQAYLRSLKPITHDMVNEAREIITSHGEPFNEDWTKIVDEYGGKLPIKIEALPEGTVHELGVPQVQVCNTDPRFPWLTSYVETSILRGVWYPSTVATTSWNIKQTLRHFLHLTSDDPEGQLLFRLHDFGARGATSSESAMIGGMAHLVNFRGTDTMEAIVGARRYYDESMAGWSIPAAEHSTITTWGESGECSALGNLIDKFGGTGKLLAGVSDSYDLFRAVTQYWGTDLKEKVLRSGGTVVIRPDSGDPVTIVMWTVRELDRLFGSTVNGKGFKVLHPAVRVIQGDGVNPESILHICHALFSAGYSIENVAFGMGGALLQKLDRDTFGYAMKANAVADQNGWRPVSKNPKTDSTKKSKAGRQGVIVGEGGSLVSVPIELLKGRKNLLEEVWVNGEFKRTTTLSEVRARSEQ